MTSHEFAIEMKEVYQLFEKPVNEALNKRLFKKVESLEASEFRAVITRALDECDHFPRLSKWQALKEWIVSKRAAKEKLECQRCHSTGCFGAVCLAPLTYDVDNKPAKGVTFYFRCGCENMPSDKRATFAWRDDYAQFYAAEWSRDYFKRVGGLE